MSDVRTFECTVRPKVISEARKSLTIKKKQEKTENYLNPIKKVFS